MKNNIIHDKALVGEIKKNLKGAARDFLRGQSDKTLASAHLLLKAMIKRYHISADNKAPPPTSSPPTWTSPRPRL